MPKEIWNFCALHHKTIFAITNISYQLSPKKHSQRKLWNWILVPKHHYLFLSKLNENMVLSTHLKSAGEHGLRSTRGEFPDALCLSEEPLCVGHTRLCFHKAAANTIKVACGKQGLEQRDCLLLVFSSGPADVPLWLSIVPWWMFGAFSFQWWQEVWYVTVCESSAGDIFQCTGIWKSSLHPLPEGMESWRHPRETVFWSIPMSLN